MKRRAFWGLVGGLLLSASPAWAQAVATPPGRTISQPADTDLYFLAFQLAGIAPPFAALAARDPKVESADEFKRNTIAGQVEQLLRARAQGLAGTKLVKVNLHATIGEFDAKYEEYNFVGLGDGTYIGAGTPFGHEVRLSLTNGGEAQAWKLDPKNAEAVLQRNRGGRSVTLALTLELVGAATPVDGMPIVIDTNIIEYDVLSGYGDSRLGKVVLRTP